MMRLLNWKGFWKQRVYPMTDLSKLIEEMEAAGEGRTEGPWEARLGYSTSGRDVDELAEVVAHPDDPRTKCTIRELRTMEGNMLPRMQSDARFIAFAGTHWQRILEALKQAQAENERLRENYAQLRKAAADLVIVQYQIANSIEGKAVVNLIKEDDLAY